MAKNKKTKELKDPQPGDLDETPRPRAGGDGLASAETGAESGKKAAGGRLQWVIIAAVPVVFAGVGFTLGRLIGPSATANTADSTGQAASTQPQLARADGSQKDSQKGWYFDLEPVVANLNEPGATRYVRVALTLEISNELDQKKTTAFLQENAPLLKNLLTIYLSSQTIEDMRGDRNLRRIQLEVLDNFNEKLFTKGTGHIKQVLLKEFAIQ